MTNPESTPQNTLETQIDEWRGYMQRRREFSAADTDELEDHLRGRIEDLIATGLSADEAFLVAVKRIGSLDSVTREFAREHSDRLWKQLVLTDPEHRNAEQQQHPLGVMLLAAVLAGLAIQLPRLFGLTLDEDAGFFARNLSLIAFLPLAGYLAWVRRANPNTLATLAALFTLGAVAANAYPYAEDAPVTLLTAIHLPIALWFAVGIGYAGGDWRSATRRMDFIRFTGEWFIYYVLIALGGGVLTGITVAAFNAIGIDAVGFMTTWVLPSGAMGAVVVAAWLVEAKQSVIENMAPVLTRVFTPLFVLTLAALFVGVLSTGAVIDVDRDALIVFDLLLVVVLGLVLYSISAREPTRAPGRFDALQLALVTTTLVVNGLMLAAMVSRINEFGFSANKTAALGENLVLLVNLAWSAWLLLGFLRGRSRFVALERWQTTYLAVFAGWAWVVALAFPLMFGSGS